MKLETIRKSKKKSILIGGLIALLLVSVVTYTTTRAKYRSVQSVKLATGTVKYSEYDFKVIAMYKSEDGTNYSDIETMPGSDYVINEDRSYCTTDGVIQNKGKLKTNAAGEHVITNLNKSEKCYIWFDKKPEPITSETIIAAIKGTNVYKGDSATPTFTSVATGDGTVSTDNSGVYRVADPMYKTTDNQNPMSYYFRGAVKNNYVKFGGKCWRIVRINGDGSIRLIYDGTTCHANGTSTSDSIAKTSIKYNNSAINSAYVGWTYTSGNQRPSTAVPQTSGTASNIKTVTENWFNSDAGFTTAQKAQVEIGKFCNDRATQNNESWRGTGSTQYYAAYQRLSSGNNTPTLACGDGDIYHSQVGLITADEVQFAGASIGTQNKSYYLYNGQHYWTMSPYRWSGNNAQMFIVYGDSNGNLGLTNVSDTTGVRPVINLKADTLFAEGGNGSQSNPYVVQ